MALVLVELPTQLAVTGDTVSHMARIKELNGTFNRRILDAEGKLLGKGYTFPLEKREAVEALIAETSSTAVPAKVEPAPPAAEEPTRAPVTSRTGRRPLASLAPPVETAPPVEEPVVTKPPRQVIVTPAVEAAPVIAPAPVKESAPSPFEFFEYSLKSYAIFGDTKPIEEQLSALGASKNGGLTHPVTGKRTPGYVIGKRNKHLDEIKSLIKLSDPAARTHVAHAFTLQELQRASTYELRNATRNFAVIPADTTQGVILNCLRVLGANNELDPRLCAILDDNGLEECFVRLSEDTLIDGHIELNIPYAKGMTHFAAAVTFYVYTAGLVTPEMITLLKDLTPTFQEPPANP